MRIRLCFLLVVCLSVADGHLGRLAYAQAADTAAAPTTPTALNLMKQREQYDSKRLPVVEVLGVSNPSSKDTSRFHLNDYIVLQVRDLRLALRRSKRPFKDLRLFVDDITLPMPPIAVDTLQRRDTATVHFQLIRNPETELTWQRFYKIPGTYEHPGRINIGFDNGQLGKAYPNGDDRLQLVLVQEGWLWVGVALLAVLVGLFFWLANNSTFIRSDRSNRIPLDKGGQAAVINKRYRQVPFSLAKSQVAYWTLLVVGAYLMISLVTSALPSIPSGLLGLLGISIANGLFSQLINRTQDQATVTTATPGHVEHIEQSRGWFQDVLTDLNGISVARLQFVVFNAVVGLYLIRYVLAHWSLPELDSSILALISISSAGFLVQKNTETTPKPEGGTTLPPGGGPGPSRMPPGGGNTIINVGTTPAGPTPDPIPTASPVVDTSEPPAPAAAATTPERLVLPGTARGAPAAAPPPSAPPPDALQRWNQLLTEFKERSKYVDWDSDPGKEVFGPLPEALNGRRLEVTIVSTLKGGLDLLATVTKVQGEPLTGEVVFLLHPTYRQRVVRVPVQKDDQVRLGFFSAGTFTVVAMMDAGKTILAYDLAKVAGAPESFLDE